MTSMDDVMESARQLMDLDGVVGVGEGIQDGRPCVVVFVNPPGTALAAKLPRDIQGVPVVVEESGPFMEQH